MRIRSSRVYTVTRVSHAGALIRADLYLLVVLINQFAIRRTSVDNSTVVAAFNRGAAEILLGRLCVWSEAEVILSFEGGGSCIDISTSARVMRWKTRNEEI